MISRKPSKRKPAARKPRAKLAKWLKEAESVDLSRLRHALLGDKAIPTSTLAVKFKVTPGTIVDAIKALGDSGVTVEEWTPGEFVIHRELPPNEQRHSRTSDKHGWHRFGVISDTHLGSKYERLDVCIDLYDWFAAEGITTVYHAGNWIDGECRFNKHDLLPEAHGMQAQLDYFVRHYPQRKGIETHYVTGDDHEGWYAQREGVDIGAMLQRTGEDAGRHDLKHLGYKEAYIELVQGKTGELSRLLVDHPGGGSAYADSYKAQKAVESLQSGEKPGMWIFGHWHKLGFFRPREVFVILAGCTKDSDTFGRKKQLRYDIGGHIVEARQDERGALVECKLQQRAFFDRGYHAGTAFSMSGKVRRK